MTKAEMLALPAGPELDAQIATLVMGWHEGLHGMWHDASDVRIEQRLDADDYYQPTPAWSPSTEIADAWDIVDWLRRQGYSNFALYADNGWGCTVWHVGHNGHVEPVPRVGPFNAPDAPLAICRTALMLALEGKLP